MDTILDYIRWRGDLPLSHDGLRDADALVLSLLTYLDLKPIWEERPEPLRLRDCRKMIDEGTARILITGSGLAITWIRSGRTLRCSFRPCAFTTRAASLSWASAGRTTPLPGGKRIS